MQEFFLVCPQGDTLSPLLSNVMPTEFDRGLEKRGHKFAAMQMTTIFMLIVRRQEKELWAA